MDAETKGALSKLPLLTVKCGPRDGDGWIERLKEELSCLVKVRDDRAQLCGCCRRRAT